MPKTEAKASENLHERFSLRDYRLYERQLLLRRLRDWVQAEEEILTTWKQEEQPRLKEAQRQAMTAEG